MDCLMDTSKYSRNLNGLSDETSKYNTKLECVS